MVEEGVSTQFVFGCAAETKLRDEFRVMKRKGGRGRGSRSRGRSRRREEVLAAVWSARHDNDLKRGMGKDRRWERRGTKKAKTR